jgi:hypothetical protein
MEINKNLFLPPLVMRAPTGFSFSCCAAVGSAIPFGFSFPAAAAWVPFFPSPFGGGLLPPPKGLLLPLPRRGRGGNRGLLQRQRSRKTRGKSSFFH